MVILSGKARTKFTPAVLEAIIVEKGLIVETIVPNTRPEEDRS